MSESETSTGLVVPGIGELVDLTDAKQVAVALDGVRQLEFLLKEIKPTLTRALAAESARQGQKTLHLDGVKVEIKGGSEIVYDAEEIEKGLRAAEMPEERIREIVVETVSYKVAGVKAKQAASANPAYAAVIQAHSRVQEKPTYASISLRP